MADAVGVEVAVNKSHRERLVELRSLLEFGKTYRQEQRETAWRQSEQQYLGNHWETVRLEDPTADLITINLSFSTVNTIVPYVTSQEPRFLVTPYSKDATKENARLQQAWLNRLWRKQSTGAQETIESCAEDYLIYGDGFGKVSYTIEDKMRGDGQPDTVTVAEIFVDRVDPWDLWIDPMSDGLHNARWVAHRIYTTKTELENDPRYDHVDLDDLVAMSASDVDDSDRGTRTAAKADTPMEYIRLYEFYDLVHNEMWTFTDTGDLPLRVVEEVKLAPIVQFANYRIPRNPYHMGELEQMWPIQLELNKSRSQLITHRRRNVAKYLIREDAITEAGKKAIQSPVVGEMVPIKGEIPLDSLVTPAHLAPLPAEAYNSADQAERDIYEITGVNEYLRGATPEIRRTATEASIIEGASNVKTRAKLSDIERAVRKLGTLIIETAKDVYPTTDVDEMAMYLTGGEAEVIARDALGAQADALVEQGDIDGARRAKAEIGLSDVVMTPNEEIFVGIYEVDVESGSTEMRSPQVQEQKYRDMAQSLVGMSQALAQSGVNVNLRKVFEMWFEAAGITDVEGMFAQSGQAPQPGVAPPLGGVPPEIAAALGAGPPGGIQPGEGQPNPLTAAPPIDVLSDENTGAFAPA